MSNTFSKAIELASKLSKEDQEALGAILMQEMRSEKRWTALFESSQPQLARLADAALREHKSGKSKPMK